MTVMTRKAKRKASGPSGPATDAEIVEDLAATIVDGRLSVKIEPLIIQRDRLFEDAGRDAFLDEVSKVYSPEVQVAFRARMMRDARVDASALVSTYADLLQAQRGNKSAEASKKRLVEALAIAGPIARRMRDKNSRLSKETIHTRVGKLWARWAKAKREPYATLRMPSLRALAKIISQKRPPE